MKTACDECGLHTNCVNGKLRYIGEGQKKILIVTDYPCKEEDEAGKLGFGNEFTFLSEAMKELGFDLKKDCFYTTAVNCRPLGGQQPVSLAVKACSGRLHNLIARLEPKIVILLGEEPFKSVIGSQMTGRITNTAWTSFLGYIIPDQKFGTYLAPISSVGYLLSRRQWPDGNWSKPLYERDPAALDLWMKHLDAALIHDNTFYQNSHMRDGVMHNGYIENCLYTQDPIEATKWLDEALSWEYLAFDYETTGIKPHKEGHEIVSASISDGMWSYAFPMFNDKNFRRAWKRLMLSDVKKIGHNIQFEDTWTNVILGYNVASWHWDCMVTAHIIHNLKPTGLKFLTYVHFGDIGYDDSTDRYISASDENVVLYGANAFNRMKEAPIEDVLLYNALDSLYTYKLWEVQKSQLLDFQKDGNDFFLETSIALSKAHENGFAVDPSVWIDNKACLEAEMEEISKAIYETEEAKRWDKEVAFNFNSTQQLSYLLFEVLGLKPNAYTDGGKPAVDKDNLPAYDIPIINLILKYRRLDKIVKYFNNCLAETVDNKIHAFTNINTVDTFRSSARDVNYQNIFKRDAEAKKLVREGFIPRPGNRLIEYDFKSIEVMISACNNLDPSLIRYVTDSSTDMHLDSAAECFILKPSEVTKDLRQAVKGHFVFAEFYGSYYKQVAVDLWEDAKQFNLLPHLKSHGIKNYTAFENHIRDVEDKFWGERFPIYSKWRKLQYKSYLENGYVDLMTGFRAYGPMSRNNTFNTPVQGAAYHVLQWMMNRVTKLVDTNCERSYVVGEIHDALVMDVHPSEEAWIDEWVYTYGTIKVREKWPWIIVPLVIEKEASEIDGCWAYMKGCGKLGE